MLIRLAPPRTCKQADNVTAMQYTSATATHTTCIARCKLHPSAQQQHALNLSSVSPYPSPIALGHAAHAPYLAAAAAAAGRPPSWGPQRAPPTPRAAPPCAACPRSPRLRPPNVAAGSTAWHAGTCGFCSMHACQLACMSRLGRRVCTPQCLLAAAAPIHAQCSALTAHVCMCHAWHSPHRTQMHPRSITHPAAPASGRPPGRGPCR